MARPDAGPIDGLLLLDKPTGLSSNAALQRVRRALGGAKAGHTGTLDPMASGLLPVCVGEATKYAQFLLHDDKAYAFTVHLGVATDTGDAEGRVVGRRPCEAGRADVERAAAGLVGEIEQEPPRFSALKHQGRPFYDYARRGQSVPSRPRRVRVDALGLVAFEPPLASFTVRCGKGTYVRSLAESIGAALGCGGHVSALRRTAVGSWSVDEAIALEALEALPADRRAACLRPLVEVLGALPEARLAPAEAEAFVHGRRVACPPGPAGLCKVLTGDGRLLGVGRDDGAGTLAPQRLLASGRGVPSS